MTLDSRPLLSGLRTIGARTPSRFGSLCTDRGQSYDAKALAGIKQQKCRAHLQRSVREVLATTWGRGWSFGLGLRRLFAETLAFRQGYHAGTAIDFAAQASGLRQRLDEHLRERVLPDPDNQRFLDGLRWHHQQGNLLRFLDDPRIEPTNNRAERALRPAGIARKVSHCSKNQPGAGTFAAFASVTRTLTQRGTLPIDVLVSIFRRSPLPPENR